MRGETYKPYTKRAQNKEILRFRNTQMLYAANEKCMEIETETVLVAVLILLCSIFGVGFSDGNGK